MTTMHNWRDGWWSAPIGGPGRWPCAAGLRHIIERCLRLRVWRASRATGLAAGARLAAAAGLATVLAAPAIAGPEEATVVRGDVRFDRAGAHTTITASDRAIINFKSFDLGAHESVRFVQPSSSSRVLNRINSPVPTRIDGSLSANGIVYLVNPSGVIFGRGAKIDVAGITAAAGRISDADFVRGVDRFTDVRGDVVNRGLIDAGESVRLIGQYVENSGVIRAGGSVLMAAGDDVLVSEDALGGVHVRVTPTPAPEAHGPPTPRSGKPRAALGAGDLYSLAITQNGTVASPRVKIESGRPGAVRVRGQIDARPPAQAGPETVGGRVEVLGSRVELQGATIDASGPGGGGTVLVGGDYQGRGDVRRAGVNTTDEATTIRADATENGDGGRIILWADQFTRFGATLSARGGPGGGDGGFAEVSARDTLDFGTGRADLAAPLGARGTLLFDPTFIRIIDGGVGDQDAAIFSGFLPFSAIDTANNTVSWSRIASLLATGSVQLQATGQILVDNVTGATPGVTAADGTVTLAGTSSSIFTLETQNGPVVFGDVTDRIVLNGGGRMRIIAGGTGLAALGGLSVPGGFVQITTGGNLNLGPTNALTVSLTVGPANPAAVATQSGPITASNLSLFGQGDIRMETANNEIGGVSAFLTGPTARISVRDDTGFQLGNASATGTIIGLNPGNRLVLQTNGLVTQIGPIAAHGLQLFGAGSFNLSNPSNDINVVAGALGGGNSSVELRDSNGFAIGTVVGSGLGTLTNAQNRITLQTDGTVNATAPLVTGQLRLLGAGSYELLALNNDVVTVAAALTGPTSSVQIRDENGFTVGTVFTTPGIDVGNGPGNVLSIQSGGGVAQTQPVRAGQFRVLGTGFFTLSTLNNDTGVLAASLSGSNSVLGFRDDTGFAIGSVLTTDGVSIAVDSTNRLTLRSDGVVTQTRPIVGGAVRLIGNGSFDLGSADNNVTVLAANLFGPSSRVAFRDTDGFDIGPVASTLGIVLPGGALNTAALDSGGAVTQSRPISAGGLSVIGAGSADLSTQNNTVGMLAAALTGPGSTLSLRADAGLTLGQVGVINGVSVGTGAANALALRSNGAVTQTAAISAGTLALSGDGSFTLDHAGNEAGELAALLGGPTSTLAYRDVTGFVIGDASGLSGLTLPAGVPLSLAAGGAVTQTRPIVAGPTALFGAGSFDLSLPGNTPVTIAATLTGVGSLLRYRNDAGIEVGSVLGAEGISLPTGAGNTALLISDGSITQTRPVQAGGLAFSGAGNVTFDAIANETGSLAAGLTGPTRAMAFRDDTGFSIGDVDSVTGVNVGGGPGSRVVLRSDGSVTQTRPVVTGEMVLSGAGSFTLTDAGNDTAALAAQLTGAGSTLSLRDANGFLIDQLGGVTGVSLPAGFANTVSFSTDGAILQSRPISAGALRITGQGLADLASQNNAVGVLAADLTGAGSSLTFRDDTGFTVGVVGPTSGVSVGTGASNDVAFRSAGSVTQAAPLVARGLTLSGPGSFTFERADNTIASLTLTGPGGGVGGAARVVADPGGGLLTITGGSAASVRVESRADLRLSGVLTSAGAAELVAGSDGSGTLTFGVGAGLRGQTLTLLAGDGPGGAGVGATIDAATNAPTFANAAGAGLPLSMTVRADGLLSAADLPAPVQFAGGLLDGLVYTLRSTDAGLSIADATKVDGSVLTADGAPVTFSTPVAVRSLATVSPVVLVGPVTLRATQGPLTLGSTLASGAAAAALLADEIELAGDVTGAGTLTIAPSTVGVETVLGGVATAGRLDLSAAELARIQPGLSQVVLGAASGTLRIVGPVAMNAPTTMRGSTRLEVSADVVSRGVALTFADNATFGASSLIRTTDAAPAGADVAFLGSVDAATGATPDLTLIAGSGGTVRLGGPGVNRPVGALLPLRALNTSGATIVLPAVTTTGAQTHTGAIDLRGDMRSSAGAITLAGPAAFTGDRLIDAATTLTAASITSNARVTLRSGGLTSISGPVNTPGVLDAQGTSLSLTGGGSAASATLSSSGATTLSGGWTTTGTMSLNSGGITITGPLTIGDTFNAVSSAALSLIGPWSAGGNATLQSSGAMTLAGTGTSGPLLRLTAGNSVSATGALTVAGDLEATTTAGPISLTGGGSAASMTAISAGLATISGGWITTGAMSLNSGGATITGPLTIGGPLNTVSSAALSLAGPWSAGGATTLQAGGAAQISGLGSSGGPATVNASGPITLTGPLTWNAGLDASSGGQITTAGTNTTTGLTRLRGASLALGGTLASTGSIDAATPGDLLVSGVTRAPTVLLHAASDGTGVLSFTSGSAIESTSLLLRAGDGTGGATSAVVDARSGAPTFRGLSGGATSPSAFTIRQDAGITDALTAAFASFPGGLGATAYRLQSDDGGIVIADASKFAGANLTVASLLGFSAVPFSPTSLTIEGPLAAGDQTIDVGTGTLSLPAGITANGNLTLRAGEMDFGGPISGPGALTLEPGSSTLPILLAGSADSGPGTLDLTRADLDAITDGWSLITIGRPDGSGLLSFADAYTFRDPLTLRTGAGAGMALNRDVGGSGDASLRFESPVPVRLSSTITNPGRSVTFAAPTRLDADAAINAPGGTVLFTGPIDAAADAGTSLTINSNSATFGAPVGAAARPLDLTIAGPLSASDVRAARVLSVAGPLSLSADAVLEARDVALARVTSPAVRRALTVRSNDPNGLLRFTGPVGGGGAEVASLTVGPQGRAEFADDVRSTGPMLVRTEASFVRTGPGVIAIITGGGPVTFQRPITGSTPLRIDAGSGEVGFDAINALGVDGPIPAITLLGAGLSTFSRPATLNSGLVAAGPTRFVSEFSVIGATTPTILNNAVDFSDAMLQSVGDITLGFVPSHPIVVSGATTVRSTGGAVRVPGTIDGTGALTLDAPVGSVRLDAPTGAATRLASLGITSPSVAAAGVRTTGPQSITTGRATLLGDLTAGGPIAISGPVTLGADVSVTSDAAGLAVDLSGPIDSDTPGTRGLAVNAPAGSARLGNIGDTNALSGFSISSPMYELANVRSVTDLSLAGAKTLRGDLSVLSGRTITIDGATTIDGGADGRLTFTVGPRPAPAGGPETAINLRGTIDDLAANATTLALDASVVDSAARIGGTAAPRALDVTATTLRLARTSLGSGSTFRSITTLSADVDSAGGELRFVGPLALAADVTLTAPTVTLLNQTQSDSPLTPRALTVAAAGSALLGADVGAVNPLRELSVTGTGVTTIGGDLIRTLGPQTYGTPVVFAAPVFVRGASLRFNGAIEDNGGGQSVTLLTPPAGTVTFATSVGAAVPLGSLRIGASLDGQAVVTGAGNPILNNAGISLGGDVSAAGAITFGGPVELASDATIRSQRGTVLFRGPVDSAAGTPRRFSVLTDRDTSATQPTVPLITFGALVGASRPLAAVHLNYLPASLNGGAEIDGRAITPTVATVFMSDRIDADGNPPASGPNSGPLSITADGPIVFGRREKLTALGNVTLRSLSDRVAVGDITALGDVNVIAPTIQLRRREAASVLDAVGITVPDLGTDYVTSGVINLSVPPTAVDDGPDPTFSNPTGNRGSNLDGFSFRLFAGSIALPSFVQPRSNVASALDLRSLGPSDTNVAQAIAGAIPTSDTGSVTTGVVVGAGLRDQLAEIGIFVKDLAAEDVVQLLAGRAVFNDVPVSGDGSITAGGNPFADPALGEYRVSVNRLPTSSVIDVLGAYQALAYTIGPDGERADRRPALRDALAEAWRSFGQAEAGGRRVRLDARRFRCYLEERGGQATESELLALITLEQIKDVLDRLRGLGLSPVEYQISRTAILSGVAPDIIGTAALGVAAETDCAALAAAPVPASPPAAAPEPADGAAPAAVAPSDPLSGF